MPHKSGSKAYPASKGHPGKGKHMSDAQMKTMMAGKKAGGKRK